MRKRSEVISYELYTFCQEAVGKGNMEEAGTCTFKMPCACLSGLLLNVCMGVLVGVFCACACKFSICAYLLSS